MHKNYPFYLANEAHQPNKDLVVTDKYSDEIATHVALASAQHIDQAIAAAVKAAPAFAKMKPYERKAVLQHCVIQFRTRAEEMAQILCVEAGKPLKDSRGEVARLIETFEIAAEESIRINGETLNLAISERSAAYQGFTKRVPIGPCSFISPFNFPLNLAAHKIAPAIAAGCPFVLKPASLTPIGALIIGEVLAETNLPKGAFSILPCKRDGAELFTSDERLKLLSFTGSPDVGWDLKSRAGKKKVILELGGNAACIVDKDWPLDDAVQRMIIGAFYQSGQSCISVQRIYVHEFVYEEFKNKLVAATKKLISGDPKNENTFIGPMISVNEAERLQGWINQAIENGATLLCGGNRKNSMVDATLLENVDKSCDLNQKEAFGPVAILTPFSNFENVLEEVNNSDFGLQAGIFTKDLYQAMRAWEILEVGGVIIGDIPSWRVDHMPYGGVKDSGLGREGIRYAIEDMTEIRLMAIRTP
ncbi:MAG: aldehyde dehydrogenase family protein [Pseudomonadota bacterium]